MGDSAKRPVWMPLLILLGEERAAMLRLPVSRGVIEEIEKEQLGGPLTPQSACEMMGHSWDVTAFHDCLFRLGISQSGFSHITGIGDRAVRGWGVQSDLPYWVRPMLVLLEERLAIERIPEARAVAKQIERRWLGHPLDPSLVMDKREKRYPTKKTDTNRLTTRAALT